jgi:phosphate-selective porin OprO/OprP
MSTLVHSATASLLATILATAPALSQAPTPVATPDSAIPQTVDAQLIRQLLQRIGQLESRLAAIEGGQLLPEITVSTPEGPTPVELEAKVDQLARQSAEQAAQTEKRSREQPRLSVGASGIRFASADTNFTFRLRGLIQADSATYFDDNPLLQGNDGFSIRRVRASLHGTLYRDIEFAVIPQWGGVNTQGSILQDAYVAYHLGDHFTLTAGKFKGPVGLGMLQSIMDVEFNERSLATGLVPLRNIGIQLSGSFFDDAVSLAAGVFNSAGDQRNPGNADFNDDREFAGRVFIKPFKNTNLKPLQNFGIGIGGSYTQIRSNAFGLPAAINQAVPGYNTTPGLQPFFAYDSLSGAVVADGRHWRLSPQGYWYHGPVGIFGEYVRSDQGVYNATTFRAANLGHSAWQITAQYVLTGEKAGFTAIEPKRPFTLGSPGWGAWQLVGRFSRFDIDDDAFPSFANPDFSATDATSWSVGVNWWINRNVRLLTSYTRTTFTGGGAPVSIANPGSALPPSTVTAQDENLFSTRIQVAF